MTYTSKTAKIIKRWYCPHHIDCVSMCCWMSVSYWWSMVTRRLSGTVNEIFSLEDNGVTTLTFGVTWRHRSRDHSTPHGVFSIGGQWWPGVYLARLLRYPASKISGSRHWPFVVTWRHRSHDHSTSQWGVSYRLPMVTKRLSGTVIEIFSLEDNKVATLTFGVTIDHILPIQYTTFMGLRWQLRGVYSWKFYTGAFLPKIFSIFLPNFDFGGIFQGVKY